MNTKRIKISRNLISLNDIQHGILRKSKFKIGLGYIPNPFYSSFIKSVAVDKLDYRIHFALGSITVKSISLPIYDSKDIDRQLSIVTQIYLHLLTDFDHDSKTIQVSDFILHNWKDFGGKKSVIQIMENIFKKDFSAYRLRFKTDNLINTNEHSF